MHSISVELPMSSHNSPNPELFDIISDKNVVEAKIGSPLSKNSAERADAAATAQNANTANIAIPSIWIFFIIDLTFVCVGLVSVGLGGFVFWTVGYGDWCGLVDDGAVLGGEAGWHL
jgi:hypothetical protein